MNSLGMLDQREVGREREVVRERLGGERKKER
jgi:hypothetical protein